MISEIKCYKILKHDNVTKWLCLILDELGRKGFSIEMAFKMDYKMELVMWETEENILVRESYRCSHKGWM